MLRQRLGDRRTLGIIGGLYLVLGLLIPWSVYLSDSSLACGIHQNCPQHDVPYLPRTMSGLVYLRQIDPTNIPHLLALGLINLLPVGVGLVALALNLWGKRGQVQRGMVRFNRGLVVILWLTVACKTWIFVITPSWWQGNEALNSISILLMIGAAVALWRNARWWQEVPAQEALLPH